MKKGKIEREYNLYRLWKSLQIGIEHINKLLKEMITYNNRLFNLEKNSLIEFCNFVDMIYKIQII